MSERYAAGWGVGTGLAEHRQTGSFRYRDPSRDDSDEARHAGQRQQTGGRSTVGPYVGNGIDYGGVGPWLHSSRSSARDSSSAWQIGNWLVLAWSVVLAIAGAALVNVAMSV
jgi:hypothetical protein